MYSAYIPPKPDFLVDNIDIASVTRDKNHKHSFKNGRLKHGFIYVVRGGIRDEFLGDLTESVELCQGELIFIPKDCSYIGTYIEDDTSIRIVQFDIARGQLPEYLSRPIKIEISNAAKSIGAFFDTENDHDKNKSFYYMYCLYGLLWQISESLSRIPTKYRKLDRALGELNAHFDINAPIADYAAICDMSEVNFRRLFREYIGKSPVEYRNELRLENARARILSGEYNVTEAAESVGFVNLSFFIKLYKRKYGHTPKKE